MVNPLTKFSKRVVLSAVIFAATVNAEQRVQHFSIADDAKGKPNVVGSIRFEAKFIDTPVLKQRSNDRELALLGDYYRLGRSNDGKGIVGLSYAPDGSRSWMANELVNIPDKFAGFTKLVKVVATDVLYWGQYSIYGVDWYVQGDRKVGSWMESVICPSVHQCKLSNLVLNGTSNSELFSIAAQKLAANKLGNITLPKHKLSIYPDFGRKHAPLDIHFNVKWLKKKLVLGDVKKPGNKGNMTPLHQYIAESIDARSHILEAKERDEQLKAQVAKYWHNLAPQEFIPVVNGDSVSQYLPLAFLQKLGNMDSYEAYGLLEAEHEAYVIGSMVRAGVKSLLVLPLENKRWKLVHQPQNKGLYDIVHTAAFYQNLNALIARMGLANE